MIGRRGWLGGMGAGGTALVLGGVTRAAPNERADLQKRRLDNRLELWANFSRRTEVLTARYTTTRYSSLLAEPLVAIGTLGFVAPDRLIMVDDGTDGSTTRIHGERISIALAQDPETQAPIDGSRHLAAAWLAARLVRAFAPGQGPELVAGCRYHIPRTRAYKLELLPARGSAVRKTLRSVTLMFDPVGGAVTELEIHESQGDRVHIGLRDHRQNVPREELARLFADATLQP